MATITTLKPFHEQDSDIAQNGNIITYQETWLLQLSERVSLPAARNIIGALTSSNAYGFPIMGKGTHTDDSNLTAVNYTISRDQDAGYKFLTTVNYTNDIQQISKSKPATDGTTYYDYQEVNVTEEVDVDPIDNVMIQNTADAPVFPKLRRQVTLDRIIITRNESRFKPSKFKVYRNKVNNSGLTINGDYYDPRSILVQSITGRPNKDADGNIFYTVKYVVLYDPDKLHKRNIIDVHYGPDKAKRYPQLAGSQWNRPWKLSKTGSGEYATLAEQQDPSYYNELSFNVYGEVNLSPLRL